MRVEIAAREVLAASRGRLRAVGAGIDVIVAPAQAGKPGAEHAHHPVVADDDTIRACARLAQAGVRAIPRLATRTTPDRRDRQPTEARLAAFAETGGVGGVVVALSGRDADAGAPAVRGLLGSGRLARFGMHRVFLAWRWPGAPADALFAAASDAEGIAASIDIACERWMSLVRLARACGHHTTLLLDGRWPLAAVARVAIRMFETRLDAPVIADLDDASCVASMAEAGVVAAHADRLAALGRLRRYAGLDIGAKLTGRDGVSGTIAHLDAVRLAAGLRDLALLDTIAS